MTDLSTPPNSYELEVMGLKPCPWCTSDTAFVERADFSSCYVVCNDCGAKGPTRCNENDADVASEDDGMEPGENAARRAWNTRPNPSPVDDAVIQDDRDAAVAVCEMVVKASLFETRQSKGESLIGWQKGDEGSALRVRHLARQALSNTKGGI